MIYISNGLSPKMLNKKQNQGTLKWTRLSKKQFKDETQQHETQGDKIINCIGHSHLANMLNIPFTRMSIILESGDILYVIQDRQTRKHTTTTLPLRLNIIRYEIT